MSRNLDEHILQTASELFYQQGIKATGIDSIVKASGVAKMTLYKYFPSKDDLVLAHLKKRGAALYTLILDGITVKDLQPQQKLLAVFEVFSEILARPDFRGCPFINASAEFAEAAGPVQTISSEFYASLCRLFTEINQELGISESELLARQLVLLITGAVIKEQIQRHSGAMREAAIAAEVLIIHFLPSRV